ncbi:MAG: sigma-54 dependent transcriptional regulator [Acidobacteria bacterium]|nr:sigma-54 dependent transcriptional regulator [Acidobacteriota bacterium]
MPNRALIVSPNHDIRSAINRVLYNAGWTVSRCHSLSDFLRITKDRQWELVFVSTSAEADLSLDVLTKFELEIKSERTRVVVVARNPTTEAAMFSLQAGAEDYVVWPLLPSEILAIAQGVKRRADFNETKRASSISILKIFFATDEKQQFAGAKVGASRPMIELSKHLFQVAHADELPVLITGEPGAGKEMAARQIHQLSNRPGPFLAVNCLEMVESLPESELFGFEKSAFTGSPTMKKGLWEEAANGTIFLDEITEASPAIQSEILCVLQEGAIRRVGSSQEIKVTARVIAASTRDIKKAIKGGDFREDLFSQFGHVLRLPPLRGRVEDIPLLAEYFCERAGKETIITPEAMALLCGYDWPGNVRELEDVISKLANVSGRHIFPEDVQSHIRMEPHWIERLPNPTILSMFNSAPPECWPTFQELQSQYVNEAYLYFGREARVARALDIDCQTVSAIIRKEEGL